MRTIVGKHWLAAVGAHIFRFACFLAATGSTAAPCIAVQPAPQVAYTDVLSGPAGGGENDQGAYLSIFGRNLGLDLPAPALGTRIKVYIGQEEVGAYRYLGHSNGRADVEQLTVQVGKLRKARPGQAFPISVIVDGARSNEDHMFRVQPGRFLFVDNVIGDDETARFDDPDHPWRYVQTSDSQGALAQAKPGDFVVLRGKAVWRDLGRNQRWFRFRYTTGSAPTGGRETGYISVIAYPGELVRYRPQPWSYGGIHGIDGIEYPGFSSWIVIAGLTIEGGDQSVRDAPINLQARSNHWRIVNNDIGPWHAEDGSNGSEARAAGISGNGEFIHILGNHIHDIGGGTLNHCIYLDTGASDVEIAFNHVERCTGGNIIQTYDNLGTKNLERISIHHNLLHDGNRFGLNIADGTGSAQIWNNIIYNTGLAALRLHIERSTESDIDVEFNTFARPNLREGARDAAVLNDGELKGRALIANNLIFIGAESRTKSLFGNSGNAPIQLQRNYWYVRSGLREQIPDVVPAISRLDVDPFARSTSASDFTLKPGSPAAGRADGAIHAPGNDDFALKRRPPTGPSVGALECCAAR